MLNRATILAVTCAVVLAPGNAASQVGIAARGGTLGVGGELAVGLSDRVVARGGFGVFRFTASTAFQGISVDVDLPETSYNGGLDFYLNNAFRIGGGILVRPDDVLLRGTSDGPVEIGGTTLTPAELGTLTGRFASRERAGYALIGFGKHVAPGFGLSLDVGAAFTGEPTVTLEAEGGSYPADQLATLLAAESMDFERDMKSYLKIWPILSLGLRVGFGG